jgi:trimethylamine--corrinoid protein Co-methyltransferase
MGAAGAAAPGGEPAPEAQPVSPAARLQLRVLSEGDVRRVHAAAIDLLGDEAAAAEAATAASPDAFVLAGRMPGSDVWLGCGSTHLATGGPAPRVRPLAGGDPLPATAADLAGLIRLADALPDVAVVAGPPVRAAGKTAPSELAVCLAGTLKHVQLATLRTAAEAEVAVRMALAVGGSEAAVRERPPLSLTGGPEALAAAKVFARAGLPVGVVSAPRGADEVPAVHGAEPAPSVGVVSVPPPLSAAPPAPGGATAAAPNLAVALVRHHAGVLAACAAVQASAPGAPFFYLASPPLAGLPGTGPQAALFQAACVQLARFVGLPVAACGMATGSHEPDWQACTQGALGSLIAVAAGADVVGGAGTLGAGAAFGAQQLVMDGEIFAWNAAIAAGITVDEETIALDVIAQVGIGGNYLGQRHTRRHMKEVWRPRLLDRSMWDAWVSSGREGPYEKATAHARALVEDHRVAALSPEVEATLARLVAKPSGSASGEARANGEAVLS